MFGFALTDISGVLQAERYPVPTEIGGVNAEVLFSGLTPGYAGLYQINMRVPGDARAGVVDVVVTVRPAPDISPGASRPVKLAVR